MKKIMLLLAALALTGQTMPQSTMTQQQLEQYYSQQQAERATKAQQQYQQTLKSFKYQFTFTNNMYYPMTVRLKFADGKTQSTTVPAADYPSGKTHPMGFVSNACLTDAWVSGSIPVKATVATGAGTGYGSSQSVSTDHHDLNMCTSKGFTIDPLSSDPWVQLNW